MRWRRDERDTRDGMTGLGNDLVHLETRKLSAFARLGSLSHLDLYFFGIDQIFGGDTETSRSHLFGLAVERDAVVGFMEAVAVFATLAGVASSA